MVTENPTKLRTRESYDGIVKQIILGENLDFKESLGVKRLCYLNNLKYFHIVDIFNLDIFHDYLEGTVPLLLNFFWNIVLIAAYSKKNNW